MIFRSFPRGVVRAGIEAMRAQGETEGFAAMDPDDLPFAVDDDLVTTQIEAGDYLPAKLEALRAHGTQVSVDGGFFALADNVGALDFCANCCERMIDARALALAILGHYGREEDLHEVESLEYQIGDTGLRVIAVSQIGRAHV